MILIKQKSDSIGAIASMVCLIHCIATPFLFIAQVCTSSCCEATPVWWKFIDYFFLIISCLAVYRSTQTTSIHWIKAGLWVSWVSLCFVIINEKMGWLNITGIANYIPAVTLVILHLYNQKHCKCDTDRCCVNVKE